MRQLYVFRGGFTRLSAEQVAGATLPVLSALVAKSFVRRQGTRRFDMQELVRQYAASHLQEHAEEEHTARTRHAAYYVSLLQQHEPVLLSHRQMEAVAELGADIDNLRAAWDTCINFQQLDLMRPALSSLWRFYDVRNYCQEGIMLFSRAAQMVEQLLAGLAPGEGAFRRARLEGIWGDLLAYQAYFTRRLGRNSEAVALYQSSLMLLRPLKEPATLGHALVDYDVLCCFIGKFDEAWQHLNDGLPLLRESSNQWQEARCLALLGLAAHERGNYAEAQRLLRESMERFDVIGDPRYVAVTRNFYSRTMHALGKTTEDPELLREGLRQATETGDQLGIGMMLERLAVVAHLGGDEVEARRLFDEALERFSDINDRWSLSRVLNLLGYFNLALGEHSQAHHTFWQAVQVAAATGAKPSLLDALTGLAMLDFQDGNYQRAFELVIHILRDPAGPHEVKNRASRLHASLEGRLTTEQVGAAQAQVQNKSLEEVVKEALRL